MNKEERLLPCPHCGKTESLIVGTDKEFTESEEAIEKWNRRAE